MKNTGFKQKARKPLKRTPFKAKTAPRPKKRVAGRINAKKGISTGKLKKKLDAVFSKYIRALYPRVCYTCGKTNVTLQCGHFVSRQYLATRWSEENCRPQCVGCNLFGNGQLLDFEEHLIRDIGMERVQELKASRHQILKLDRAWYEREIEKYTQLLSTLS